MSNSEIWKPFPGFEDHYEVSSGGRVRRSSLLKLMPSNWGYLVVSPTAPHKKQSRVCVHRAVLEAFSGPPPSPDHVANHINGDKQDNRPENLEWVTKSENVSHAYRTGLKRKFYGSSASSAKLTEEQVSEILSLVSKRVEQKTISDIFGVSEKVISDIVCGRRWPHVPRPPELGGRRKYGSDKLTKEKVIEVRQMLTNRSMSYRAIGEHFGVTDGTIRAIAKGKTWKGIT